MGCRWVDPKDQRAQGDPETVVRLPTGDTLVGLHILGVDGYPMLGIREDREGFPVAFAAADVDVIDAAVQSNPRRRVDYLDQ